MAKHRAETVENAPAPVSAIDHVSNQTPSYGLGDVWDTNGRTV